MIHSESFGQGPDIVFLHGLFGAGDNWRSIGRSLSDRFRVHLLDLPNHGKSAWIDNPELGELANIVHQWTRDNGLGQYHLLGHSMGGKVAMQMALNDHADPLLSLTVVDIAPKRYAPHHQDVFFALNNVDFDELNDRKSIDDAMKPHVTDDVVRGFLLKSLHRKDGKLAWRFNVPVLESRYDSVAGEPTSKTPFPGSTLFIKGMNSNYITAEDQDTIRTLFPNAKAKLIEGAGHWPHAEKPAIFTKIVSDFLTER